MNKKKYSSDFPDLESKLARVMDRLGVQRYQYDWTSSKNNASCFVEMEYQGRWYRFDNDRAKSAASGRGLVFPSDLFAAVVYALEGLARAVEQGIFSLDMLLVGLPQLEAHAPKVEACFLELGFSARPESADDVKRQYRHLAKSVHPDAGGDRTAFDALTQNYEQCLKLMEVRT